MDLVIANMVCSRCTLVLKDILLQLQIRYESVEIGKINKIEFDNPNQELEFKAQLATVGFEIVSNKVQQIIEQIKSCVQHYLENELFLKYKKMSSYITSVLFYDYSYLSDIFSKQENQTIENYFISLRLDKVKEKLDYTNDSIASISYSLGFSSPQHLTTQFKQHLGLSPSKFIKLIKS
jgi:AraC family transcriptional regulator